jgi:Flp pilus assembly protein TadD
VKARSVVVVLVLALAAYFVIIGYRGVYLIGEHKLSLKVLGVAVLVLPLVGIWVVVAEIRFGQATQRLAEQLDAEDAAPEIELPRLPSGRVDRRAADAAFLERKAEVEADPGNWRGWYRLALAYDAAGDRKRAREAMRQAIEQAAPRAG